MRAIAERGAAAAAPMRVAALREGALLHHLQLALFSEGEGGTVTHVVVLYGGQICLLSPCSYRHVATLSLSSMSSHSPPIILPAHHHTCLAHLSLS